MKKISIEVSEEFHRTLKVHTANRKKTIKDFIINAAYKEIESEKELNEETIKTLEESKQGINVVSFNSLKELYKDLGMDKLKDLNDQN